MLLLFYFLLLFCLCSHLLFMILPFHSPSLLLFVFMFSVYPSFLIFYFSVFICVHICCLFFFHTLTPMQHNHTNNDVLSRAHPQSFLVGASGGCYALIAAHFANIIINWGEMPFNWVRLLVLLTLMATDIGVFAYMTLTNSATRVRRGLEGWGVCSGVVLWI